MRPKHAWWLADAAVFCCAWGGNQFTPLLLLGRMLSGAAVGIAMAVGTSWVKELSQAPYDPGTPTGTAVRRGALALTLGFGVGAGVAGALAQWGPARTVVPYVVHILLTLPVLLALRRAPETRNLCRRSLGRAGKLRDDLSVPAAGHRRFRGVVMPMAPWVFGSAGIAYAVMPQLVSGRVGHWKLAFATLLTVVTLLVGAVVQPFVKRLDSTSTARASVLALTLMAAGIAVCALDARTGAPWGALVGACVLGAAYGIAIVAGLLEISRIARIARSDDFAGLTGVYYALSYLGFLLPAVLAGLAHWWSYPTLLAGLGVLSLGCLALVGARSQRHLPGHLPAILETSGDTPLCHPIALSAEDSSDPTLSVRTG